MKTPLKPPPLIRWVLAGQPHIEYDPNRNQCVLSIRVGGRTRKNNSQLRELVEEQAEKYLPAAHIVRVNAENKKGYFGKVIICVPLKDKRPPGDALIREIKTFRRKLLEKL